MSNIKKEGILINVLPLKIETDSKYININDNIVVFNGNLLKEITLDIRITY